MLDLFRVLFVRVAEILPLFLDYRTVSGVNGPLVILDNVKVSYSLKQDRIFC